MRIINVKIKDAPYKVLIEKNILKKTKKILIDLKIINNDYTKVIIISDNKVPSIYVNTLKKQFINSFVKIVESGEKSKSIKTYSDILSFMLKNDFTRKDLVIALGGGVVGDLSAFVASTFMRGINFVNIPTTLLSQVDSSVGGKTAVNLDNTKNIVGTFYQPKVVLIDVNLLKTLSKRQISNGIAESIKMGISLDSDLFNYIEKKFNFNKIDLNSLEYIVYKSINIKKNIVEKDTREQGLRRVLNFGHTIGHGIEAYYGNKKYLHGECVAIGMIPMVHDKLRDRLICILKKVNLPTKVKFDKNKVFSFITKDKKKLDNMYNVVLVDNIGKFQLKKVDSKFLKDKLKILESINE